ncbi:MAG: HAD family hydrolase [Candidatus Spyradocola sp.]
MYRNCIFDLYGTLVDIHTDETAPAVWEKLALFYGYYGAAYAPQELRAAYEQLSNEGSSGPQYSHEAHPEIRIETVFAELFERKGVHADDALAIHAGQLFRVCTTDYLRLYPGTTELLSALRAQGRGVYLLSNAQRIFTAGELNILGIAKYFDGILISSDCAVKKPDPRFFRMLLEQYRLDPASCVMIGNDCHSDIAGAQSVGLDTIYIHSNISPDYDPAIQATHTLPEMNMQKLRTLLEA